MLREGWDVNSVTVVIGLRPFNARADILPEQAVGRGLRLMFRRGSGYTERVDIIGNSKFMKVVEELEKDEGIKLDTFEYGAKKAPVIIPNIHVVPERASEFELAIPRLTARIERKTSKREVIEGLNIGAIRLQKPLHIDTDIEPPTTFTYLGRDILSDDVLFTREYTMPQARTPGEIIAYYAQFIAHGLTLTGQFAVLAPKIQQFLQEKAFGKLVDLQSAAVIRALNRPSALKITDTVFRRLLQRQLTKEADVVSANTPRLLSTTSPFPWSGKMADVKKTLFNLTPCTNDFEREFAHFLEDSGDIAAFASVGNLPEKLTIEYLDDEANLRLYEPDFVARDTEGNYWLIETKGREDPLVPYKDARAIQWCSDVTRLTGILWQYVKVPQKEYKALRPDSFGELASSLLAGGPLFVDD